MRRLDPRTQQRFVAQKEEAEARRRAKVDGARKANAARKAAQLQQRDARERTRAAARAAAPVEGDGAGGGADVADRGEVGS